MVWGKEFLRDEPRGGFVAEVVCPWCGSVNTGNVPSTPEKKIIGCIRYYEVGVYSTTICTNRRCGQAFFIHRYSDGSWVVRRSDDAARKV